MFSLSHSLSADDRDGWRHQRAGRW